MKECKQCKSQFEITDEDLKFYEKLSPVFGGKKFLIPSPYLCPDCRQQRRLTYRNERNFYKRKCALTGNQIISVYSEDKPCKVYGYDEWWSDKWDALSYGRDFDFTRPFFEQFFELSNDVPRPCVVNMYSENSLYTNHCAYNKNCYLTINTAYGENLLYCSNFNLYDKNCVDCLAIQYCELCYFCTDCKNCSFSQYLYQCEQCHDCIFGYDLNGCGDCFCCWNLRHKKFCIFNKQYSEVDYKKKLKETLPHTWDDYMELFEKFWKEVRSKAAFEAALIEKSQNCTGSYIKNCKNVKDSYNIFDSEDCKYCYDAGELKDSMDAVEPWKGELQYETHGCNSGYNVICALKSYFSDNVYYSQYCWNSSNLFGCFGIRRKKYCIFNKQYSKEEYEKLVSRIIEHMMKTSEWGQFFSAEMSPFAYNETTANDYYPLTKEEVLEKGWKWKDQDAKHPSSSVSDDILVCEVTGRSYKLVPEELKFYEKMRLPIPKRHPDQRYAQRMALRNPRQLWDRKCFKCQTDVKSSFSPQGTEKIYCEKCYLKEVY